MKFEKVFFMMVLILSIFLISGCYQKPDIERAEDYESKIPLQESKKLSSDLAPEEDKTVTQKDVQGPKEVNHEDTEKVSGSSDPEVSDDPERPDCEGRLVATYNMDNEVTGYRCIEDEESFECPGHHVGETWVQEDGCTECTCMEDGSITCTDRYC